MMSKNTAQRRSTDTRWLRGAVELAVAFVVGVILLRAFVLEGYLISTGSMAPGLLGFHRRIVCPSCQNAFAFGVSFDESVDGSPGEIIEPDGPRRYATCPNCGQTNILAADVPNSHGDQLLVQKHFYDLRSPRRWETIVFRNPASPDEAYVKRVTGLPGETLRITDGDVYVDGEIAVKSLNDQRSMRIPVSSLAHLSSSDEWQMPWELDDRWTANDGALAVSDQGQTGGVQWLRFRNWRWSGGHHVSETPLSTQDGAEDWHRFLDRFDQLPITWTSRVRFDVDRERLLCEGVMPDDLQSDLLSQSRSSEFQHAVNRLAALSHLAPVTDRYGYNALVSSPEYFVGDLMLDLELNWTAVPDSVLVQVPIESQTFGVVVHPSDHRVDLISIDDGAVLQSAAFTFKDSVMRLEVSNFDHQILIALNGQQLLTPHTVPVVATSTSDSATSEGNGRPASPERIERMALKLEQQKRWAVGVKGGAVTITQLDVYRDVYYTPGRRRNAIDADFIVPDDSYYVLGDNSPVSSDSRSWQNATVPHHLLLGKPFLVHLPSRPSVLRFAGREWPVRIPDWGRIHVIR